MYRYEEVNEKIHLALKQFKALKKHSVEWDSYRLKLTDALGKWADEVSKDTIKTGSGDIPVKYFKGSAKTISDCGKLAERLIEAGALKI